MAEDSANDQVNLISHRVPSSIWDKRGWNGTADRPTLARLIVGVGGGLLVVRGLRARSSWSGGVAAGFGGLLGWWALGGPGDFWKVGRWFASVLERAPWHREDLVHQASADSFPASDPPAFTPTLGTAPRSAS